VLPRVDVQPRRSPILGLGLEETVVSLECVQPYGGLLQLDAPVPVEITSFGGREADADQLVLSSAAPNARFRFRSVGLGQAQIVATARTVRQEIVGSVTIEQALPWAQFLAALLGGALGGFSRRFLKGVRARAVGRRVLEGTIVGLVAFVAGVLGVGYLSLPSAIVATVAGAFLTGVIAGFAGVTVLERLSKKTVAADG
jgi:hypothetical protein